MRKNQTANQNQPSVITYPQNNFSLIRPAAQTLLSVRVLYAPVLANQILPRVPLLQV